MLLPSIINQSKPNTAYRMLELGDSLGTIEIPDAKSHIDIRHCFPYWILERADSDDVESNFVDFVQEYFNWLYSKSGFELNKTDFHISGLGKLIDIDATTVDFLPRIAYSYAPGISSLFNYEDYSLDVVSFLKNIRENLYQKKSTEEAYRYFFQTLFKSGSITISYPKESIFRLNQGRFEGWPSGTMESASGSTLKTLGASPLNSGFKLQDSDWYQDFSYILHAGIDIDPSTGLPIYYEELNSMLHPAGLKGFFEKLISDYVPPSEDADHYISFGETTKLSNYFAYRLTDITGYTACMGCSGSGFGYDGPTAYTDAGPTGGWTSGDVWSIVGSGSISANYNTPTHNWPDWSDGITAGVTFGGIHIGKFVHLYPDAESPNLGMTGCTAAGGTGECWA